ncbi:MULTISPECIES: carbohydrate kinase [unclassified Lysobacter]|uniref:carbohydrate kinase family protein n=1 Tax=unclassified Lysobacter TaxID=2635362 RepID=UPI001C211B72|nr:carbohydrate kinase [Lysobacter sp. MMG2]MBU8976907.1 carbohydrate kinase [Lysobacter sp. MMG2]
MSHAIKREAIVCFGEALIDFLALPALPGQPRHFVEFAGGAPANVCAAVARLGGNARFVGMLGVDMFGEFLMSQLRAFGVDTRFAVHTSEARTALAFVSLDEEGERSFSFYRPPAADLLFRETHFREECFDDAAVMHVCSNSLTEADIAQTTVAGMRLARERGALVSMDLNLRPSLWPEGLDAAPRLWEALAEADIIKLCRSEADFLIRRAGHHNAMLQRLWQGNARLVLITDGGKPVRWYTRDAEGEAPAFRVSAVDTTAAGDAFVGSLLLRIVERGVSAQTFDTFLGDASAIADALRHAAAGGALAATKHGAFAAMPTRDDIEQLLRTSP